MRDIPSAISALPIPQVTVCGITQKRAPAKISTDPTTSPVASSPSPGCEKGRGIARAAARDFFVEISYLI